jgi:hypothetical protein
MITFFLAVLYFALVCTAFGAYKRLSPENAAVLLVDHQTGLAQLVRDYGVRSLNNTNAAKHDTRNVSLLPSVSAFTSMDASHGSLFLPDPPVFVLLFMQR